jgi:hypothetical protein
LPKVPGEDLLLKLSHPCGEAKRRKKFEQPTRAHRKASSSTFSLHEEKLFMLEIDFLAF